MKNTTTSQKKLIDYVTQESKTTIKQMNENTKNIDNMYNYVKTIPTHLPIILSILP